MPSRSRLTSGPVRALTALAVLAPVGFVTLNADAATPTTVTSPARYLVGAGEYDITGAVAETGAFGYAHNQEMSGLHTRLYSHAFIVGDPATNKRVVVVSADLGAIFPSIKAGVTQKLAARFGSTYSAENVMITATHTHVGTSGLAHEMLYRIAGSDSKLYGWDQKNFDAVVNGIVESIARAHANVEPGNIEHVKGELAGATKNRSVPAYNNNKDAGSFPTNVDTTMTELKFTAADGRPIGMYNWFATHPTNFSMDFTQISADNKGYAQMAFEKKMGGHPSNPKGFVAAFGNTDEGDTVSVEGNSDSSSGFEGASKDDFVNAEKDGQRQFGKAVDLWNTGGSTLTGGVDYRARFVQFKGYNVDGKYTQGAGNQALCTPARGFSFAVGAENGPSKIPGLYEGMTKGSFSLNDAVNKVDQSPLGTLVRSVFGAISLAWQDPCQAEKPVLLPTGAWGWAPTVLPVQLFRIGDVAILGVPGEATTMSGRRLRESVLNELKGSGVKDVVIGGLANAYTGYIATREEYAMQHYEGASTEFGPHELGAFQQESAKLAASLRDGTTVSNDALPPTFNSALFLQRPGVVLDDKPLGQQFGQVLTQPAASYTKGQTASATFRGGHPKNNFHTMGTFLTIQRLDNGVWKDYLTDRDFDTSFTWQRESVSWSRNTVTWRIHPDAPSGTYRIVQTGDWKNGWNGQISAYKGTSNQFTVN